MSNRWKQGLAAIGIAAATLAPRTARAQTDAQGQQASPPPQGGEAPASPAVLEARQHYAQGAVLFEHENYDAALAEFQRAYELLAGNPRQYTVLYNLAQANERLFRYDAAIEFYQRYLREGGPAAEDRATVEATMHALEQLLATLRITTNVRSAEVWIDDRRVGTAPGDVRVPGGRHVVQLRAPDYLPSQQEVTVAGRMVREMNIVLQRIPEHRGISPVFSIGSFAIGAVVAGVGGAFGVSAMAASSDAKMRVNSGDPLMEFTVTQATLDGIRRTALIADVLYGVGGAFGITGLVLAFMTEWRGRPAGAHAGAHAWVAPTLLPGAQGFGIVGAF